MKRIEGKVVHVSPEMHDALRQYCTRRNLVMKHWVHDILRAAMDADVHTMEAFRFVAVEPTAVIKKQVKHFDEPNPTADEVWLRPPFWSKPGSCRRQKPSKHAKNVDTQ